VGIARQGTGRRSEQPNSADKPPADGDRPPATGFRPARRAVVTGRLSDPDRDVGARRRLQARRSRTDRRSGVDASRDDVLLTTYLPELIDGCEQDPLRAALQRDRR
jgi:hypothetical protein